MIERTMDALADGARDGSRRAAAQELHQGVPVHPRLGADDRLGRLRRRRSTSSSRCSTSTRSGRSRRSGARTAARSSSASASRPTTRCAGSPRRGSSARSATPRAAGTAPRSAACRPARCRSSPGTSPHGQGHETAWAQIVADQLGCDIDAVEVLHGDTSISSIGLDTYGSRSLPVGGVALWHAGEKVIEKARQIVAHQWEVAADDLEFRGRDVLGEGLTGQGDDARGGRVRRLGCARPSGRDGADARGDGRLRPAELLVAGGRARSRRRGRHRDGRCAARPLRRRRRRRRGRQSR